MIKKLEIVPNKQNTIVKDEQVPTLEPIFARPKQIAKLYAISESTVHRYIDEIESNAAYSNIVIRPAPSVVIIHIKEFRRFLGERQKMAFTDLKFK